MWWQGFSIATQPENLLLALLGCIIGTLVGVLPGLGPMATVGMLIPITFSMDPTQALIMLAALYYGTMYGGTITSVLVNVPGESASIITCLDGHAMAKNGRGGAALGVAAIGSFVGGTVATVALMLVALPLSTLALAFGPVEMFALLVFGLTLVAGLSGRSVASALVMLCLGLLLAMVGMDPMRGAPRLTFDAIQLYDGISFVPAAMGLFGIGEILLSMEEPARKVAVAKVTTLLPNRDEWGACLGAVVRGSGLGFLLGIIPGIGTVIPSFLSYALEKKVSKHPERFGTGVVEGVASPETANNAAATAGFVPLLALGVPGSGTTAVIMGALIINGITPGPSLFREHPDLVWGVIASFYVGNVILLILNLPLVGLWAKLLEIPRHYLYPGVLLFCILGAYSLKGSVFHVALMLVFGVIGYVLKKIGWPLVPLLMALILGPMLEKNLRRSLEMSAGDFRIFFTEPVSALFLGLAFVFLVGAALRVKPGLLVQRAIRVLRRKDGQVDVGEAPGPPRARGLGE